jgi:hypothetical protein
MPKPHTFPTLYNEALQIHISKLKGWGYLNAKQIKNGTINWSNNGNPTGSISIQVNTQSEQQYIELDYKYRDESRNYKVYFITTRSNLNRGEIWYFICPQTKKRCRKLYSIGGYFLHREAFNGCMYETQTQSKKYRQLDKRLGAYFKRGSLHSDLNKKNFKKTYAGKPTKRYLKLSQQVQIANSIQYHEIERLMLS